MYGMCSCLYSFMQMLTFVASGIMWKMRLNSPPCRQLKVVCQSCSTRAQFHWAPNSYATQNSSSVTSNSHSISIATQIPVSPKIDWHSIAVAYNCTLLDFFKAACIVLQDCRRWVRVIYIHMFKVKFLMKEMCCPIMATSGKQSWRNAFVHWHVHHCYGG